MILTSGHRGNTPADGTLEKSDLDLTAFLHILRRRLWVLIVVPILVAGTAYGYAKHKIPQYRASSTILVVESEAKALVDPSAGTADPTRRLADEIQIIESSRLAPAVKAILHYVPAIQASASSSQDVITLTAVNSSPKQAAAIVDAYAQAYLQYRFTNGAAQNAAARSALEAEVNAAQTKLNALDAAVAAQPTQALQSSLLANQADQRLPLESQISAVSAQLGELEAAGSVDQGGAQLLNRAAVPTAPFSPAPTRDAALGFAVGILLAICVAFTLDYLDNRVRGKEDLESVSGGLPVLGVIPVHPEWEDHDEAVVIALEKPDSGAAEAYRSMRTSVQFLGLDRSLHTLQVTSPATNEGKTTTVVNLAVALAKAGQRVVVVDCDLRRPRIHMFFGLEPDPGYTSVLVGDSLLSQALQEVRDVDGLRVLTSGPFTPNPSELLSGRRSTELLEALKAEADFVLIDSPPVLPVSDAAVLAAQVDATLVVVRDNGTHRKQVTRSLELLRQIDAKVIGTVLNLASKESAGYSYGYRYDYRSYVPKPASTDAKNAKNGKVSEADTKGVGVTSGLGTRPDVAVEPLVVEPATDGASSGPTSTVKPAAADKPCPSPSPASRRKSDKPGESPEE